MRPGSIVLLLGAAALAASPSEAKQRPELKAGVAFTGGCGTADQQSFFVGALLSAIVGPLVKAGVNGLGSALQKAGAPDEATVTAQTAVQFYTLQSTDEKTNLLVQQPCLLVAVDGGAENDSEFNASYPQELSTYLSSARLGPYPTFLMASAIKISPDRTAWQLVPELLTTGSPLTTSGWARGNGRDLVVTVSVIGPGVKEDDGVIATRSIRIDRSLIAASKGQALNQGLDLLATGWMPLPPPDEKTTAAIAALVTRKTDKAALVAAKAKAEAELSSARLDKDRKAARKKIAAANEQIAVIDTAIAKDNERLSQLVPVTLKVSVQETRDGNAFIASVGKFLSDNSEAIAKPIADRLDPVAHTAAQITAGAAEDKLHIDAIKAVAAWKASVAAGEEGSKQRIARIEAEAACRALHLSGFADPDCLELQ